jgi:periplasmic protein TonB
MLVQRRYSRWRLRASVVVSILVHALIFALLLLTIRRNEVPEELPPPSPVAMVFESGRKEGPSVPKPTPDIRPVTPPAAQPGEEPSLPVPPAPQAPPTPPVPPPSRPAPAQPQPAPAQPESPPEAAPPQPPEQKAEPAPPSAPITPLKPSLPGPETAEPLPLPPPPLPPQRTPPPQAKPQPVPLPRPAPPQQAVRPKPPTGTSEFPAPQDYSLSSPATRAPSRSSRSSARHPPGSIDMSLGPAIRGVLNNTPPGDDEDGGPDWRNALSQWVAAHAYYPTEARIRAEQGDAQVHVMADHFGHVKEVELIGKSGSMWLDTALIALFRDAHIPPLPAPGNDPIDFNFTMRYVLLRPPGY